MKKFNASEEIMKGMKFAQGDVSQIYMRCHTDVRNALQSLENCYTLMQKYEPNTEWDGPGLSEIEALLKKVRQFESYW